MGAKLSDLDQNDQGPTSDCGILFKKNKQKLKYKRKKFCGQF